MKRLQPEVTRGKAATDTQTGASPPHTRLRAASAVRKDRGVSKTHFWRQVKLGRIKVCNINGRLYVDMDSLAEYDRRALAGEFARKPVGAAAKSSAARLARAAGNCEAEEERERPSTEVGTEVT